MDPTIYAHVLPVISPEIGFPKFPRLAEILFNRFGLQLILVVVHQFLSL